MFKFREATGNIYEQNCFIHRSALLYDYYQILLHKDELQSSIRTYINFISFVNALYRHVPDFVLTIVAHM